ncbi:unnamed protein product, partial [Leptidea sinapis]
MNSINVLTGEEIVTRGITKVVTKLPERGSKDVRPSGTLLEQKQIESALEARKSFISVERIEKRGNLSRAEWKNELMLAEVIHKVGGHWQYLGHNVGKKLYLEPEEILYLMESNCLQLTYNGVTVSLQQAYTLLMKGNISLLQYKVYASLSRMGYKVIRHKIPAKIEASTENKILVSDEPIVKKELCSTSEMAIKENSTNNDSEIINDTHNQVETSASISLPTEDLNQSHRNKLSKLRSRELKPCNNEVLHKYFENIAGLLDKGTVTLRAPDVNFIPKNIVTRETYVLNLHTIVKKCTGSRFTYSSSEEAAGSNIERLRNTSFSSSTRSNSRPAYRSQFAACVQNTRRREPIFGEPSPVTNLAHYSLRPFLPAISFNTHFSSYRGNQYSYGSFRGSSNYPSTSTQGQRIDINQENILSKIRQIALKLILFSERGIYIDPRNIQTFQRILNKYNFRYNTNLNMNFNQGLVDTPPVSTGGVETINLDDDVQPERKKPKLDNKVLEENITTLKQLVSELRSLEENRKATSKHRRAFSKLLKTINKYHDVNYFLTPTYELHNYARINLDSSSDSDSKSINEDINNVIYKKGPNKAMKRKLKNPFNILKRLSEKVSHSGHSSKDPDTIILEERKSYSELLNDGFPEHWLPKKTDFGRPEIIKIVHEDPLFDYRRTQLLFDCANIKPMCNNWVDLKVAFLESLDETISEFHKDMSSVKVKIDNESLVKPEDCTSMQNVLQKLRIISNNYKVENSGTLKIDFDVYNKDVQNFRKS